MLQRIKQSIHTHINKNPRTIIFLIKSPLPSQIMLCTIYSNNAAEILFANYTRSFSSYVVLKKTNEAQFGKTAPTGISFINDRAAPSSVFSRIYTIRETKAYEPSCFK